MIPISKLPEMEKIFIISPWTEGQRNEFYRLQEILMNLFPNLEMIEILNLEVKQVPKELRYLIKRLYALMKMRNKVIRG